MSPLGQRALPRQHAGAADARGDRAVEIDELAAGKDGAQRIAGEVGRQLGDRQRAFAIVEGLPARLPAQAELGLLELGMDRGTWRTARSRGRPRRRARPPRRPAPRRTDRATATIGCPCGSVRQRGEKVLRYCTTPASSSSETPQGSMAVPLRPRRTMRSSSAVRRQRRRGLGVAELEQRLREVARRRAQAERRVALAVAAFAVARAAILLVGDAAVLRRPLVAAAGQIERARRAPARPRRRSARTGASCAPRRGRGARQHQAREADHDVQRVQRAEGVEERAVAARRRRDARAPQRRPSRPAARR